MARIELDGGALRSCRPTELPLHIIGVCLARRRRAQEVLDSVSLGTRARHRPYELSGGTISANGATVIAATHDLSLAAAGDRRLEMVDGSLTASG